MKPAPALTLASMRENEAGYILAVEGGNEFAGKLKAIEDAPGRYVKAR